VRLGVDRVELDVCATADGRLVLRHDVVTPEGLEIARYDFADLWCMQPDLMTLDEGLEHLGGLPVLLDVKSDATAPPLARWLASRHDVDRFAVCTESLDALLAVRERAPGTERWRSFPDVGASWREHVPRVGAALLRHRTPRRAAYLARETAVAARELRERRRDGLVRIAGMPWREMLPARLARLSSEVSAAAVSVHHWLLTAPLVEAAGALRLPIATWTVNDAPSLQRALAAGNVDMVTTDDVVGMRAAWRRLAGGPAA
jgi:glycerophosphoryl diester phosphodiesterase